MLTPLPTHPHSDISIHAETFAVRFLMTVCKKLTGTPLFAGAQRWKGERGAGEANGDGEYEMYE